MRAFSSLVLLLFVAASAACGSRQEQELRAERKNDAPASWTGLTVGEVLAQCGTPESELRMHDEPPGKLRSVEFDCHQSEPARRVILEFAYHTGLFSEERAWGSELVKAQRVIRVLESTLAMP
ncbi:hypothetical protein [Polyangium mundeleinium]|uniref:Lipoprotein n=1 Tax=Polyangium mundeleinium TaxID=2995306 RepID=A0ABT5ELT5_9BACT|nr:hypothetical protein [Polyangium mundeleinium]MDC0742783.1 hypothetical protein [Polyangium mundeleinium]